MRRRGLTALALCMFEGTVSAETLRIALRGQAGIDAFKAAAALIEKDLGVTVEIVDCPAPDKDYMSKQLTELAASNGPDLF